MMSSQFAGHSLKIRPQRIKTGLVIFSAFLISSLLGCAAVKETVKGFLGVSTKVLEDGRKDAVKQRFNYSYEACYEKTFDVLKRIEAYVYAQDKKNKMIAIYVSTIDTTPVGIFFDEIDADNTEIEVSSPSTYAKETIAARLFAGLVMELSSLKKTTTPTQK